MSRPERQLVPDRSPQDRFGYELRRWRKLRGLSQASLGKSVHVTGGLLHLVEIGERRPSRALAEGCDSTLRADGALVQAWDDFDAEDQRIRAARADIDRSVVDINRPGSLILPSPGPEMIIGSVMSLRGEDVPVAVDRRAFVAGAASLPLVGWLGRGMPQMPQSMPDGSLADIVRDMASLRVVLTKQDNILGPAVAAPTVIHQLSILEALNRNAKGSARESLRLIQAAYAEFAGWLSDELGDQRAGQYWTDRALEWAHETADDLTVGYVLARKAQRAVEAGDIAAAVSLARAAQRHGALTERVRAAALQYEALAHASTGETGDFRASIDRARELVESAGPAAAGDWAVWCTQGYVTMHEASGWVRLGKPAQAVAVYNKGLTDWPNQFRRDQGVYYGRLACAHAGAGSPEESAHVGRKALDIATGTGSARILAELRPLRSALKAWEKLPAVTEFTGALEQALSEQRGTASNQIT